MGSQVHTQSLSCYQQGDACGESQPEDPGVKGWDGQDLCQHQGALCAVHTSGGPRETPQLAGCTDGCTPTLGKRQPWSRAFTPLPCTLC